MFTIRKMTEDVSCVKKKKKKGGKKQKKDVEHAFHSDQDEI